MLRVSACCHAASSGCQPGSVARRLAAQQPRQQRRPRQPTTGPVPAIVLGPSLLLGQPRLGRISRAAAPNPSCPPPCAPLQLVEAAEAKAYYGLASNYKVRRPALRGPPFVYCIFFPG